MENQPQIPNQVKILPNNQTPMADSPKPVTRRLKKFIIISFLILISITTLLAAFFLTRLDTKIFKIKLIAAVVTTEEEPIANAEIFFEGELETETAENGIFEIKSLEPGKYDLKIVADGYSDYEEELSIDRSFMNYTVKKVFVLESEGEATLRGKFLQEDEDYNFVNDQIVIGQDSYRVNTDGTFEIKNLEAGEIDFQFQSMSFEDISQSIVIEAGANRIKDINLKPAGDITGELVSFIREDEINNPDIQIENVSESQIEFTNGEFAIKDLEIGREYAIRIIADNYVTRDYIVKIKQGENRIFDLKFVESGLTIYQHEPEDADDFGFYISEYDGKNATLLNIPSENQAENEYYNSVENKLYFSAKAPRGVSALINSSDLRTPYTYDLATNELQSLIVDTNDLGILATNYIAKKTVNITTNRDNRDMRIVQIMDLDGSNRKTLQTLNDAEIEIVKISDNGKVIYAIEENNETDDIGLFRIDVESGEVKEISTKGNIKLWDVSTDGNRVLFEANNTSSSFKDLLMYDNAASETRTIEVNVTGLKYYFLGTSDNSLLYYAEADGELNIFTLQIEQGKTKQITNLDGTNELLDIYQQGEFVYYITEKGLFVIDIQKPHNLKQVGTGDFKYSGQ